MPESNDQPRKMSRQERRHAERQAAKHQPLPLKPSFLDQAEAVTQAWQRHSQRMEALLAELADRFDEDEWRSDMIAEARSWRLLLDQAPTDAPKGAQELGIVIRQQVSVAAEVGEGIALAIESGDPAAVRASIGRMGEINALSSRMAEVARSLTRKSQRR